MDTQKIEGLQEPLQGAFTDLEQIDQGSTLDQLGAKVDALMRPEIEKLTTSPYLFFLGQNYRLSKLPPGITPATQKQLQESFKFSIQDKYSPQSPLQLDFWSKVRYGTTMTIETTPAELQQDTYQGVYIVIDGVRIPISTFHEKNVNKYRVLNPSVVDKELLLHLAQKSGEEMTPTEKHAKLAEFNRREYSAALTEIQALRLLTERPNEILPLFEANQFLLTGERLMDDQELMLWIESVKKVKSVTDSLKLGQTGMRTRAEVSSVFKLPGGLSLVKKDLDAHDMPTGTSRTLFPITIECDTGKGHQICEVVTDEEGSQYVSFHHGNADIVHYEQWMNN